MKKVAFQTHKWNDSIITSARTCHATRAFTAEIELLDTGDGIIYQFRAKWCNSVFPSGKRWRVGNGKLVPVCQEILAEIKIVFSALAWNTNRSTLDNLLSGLLIIFYFRLSIISYCAVWKSKLTRNWFEETGRGIIRLQNSGDPSINLFSGILARFIDLSSFSWSWEKSDSLWRRHGRVFDVKSCSQAARRVCNGIV